jgi:hypothetical protein
MRSPSQILLTILAPLLLSPAAASSPPGSDAVTFRDGTVLLCRVVGEDAEKVTVRTTEGEFMLPRRIVTGVSRASEEPSLGDEARKLARAAVARLSDEDPDVRRSAYRTLAEMLPAVRPLLRDAADREDTPAEVRSVLKRLIAQPARKPRTPSMHDAGARLLEDPATALLVLTKRLGLTNHQRAKAHEAIEAASAGFAAVEKKAGRKDSEEERRGVWRTFHERMTQILTEEQLESLEELLRSGRRKKDR